ncbi:hypothetical protein BRD15_10760 [Halobacteriales archaeon SW_6_65_15]|nr:MAG: hypothetical protein BRD15_10760 [Halobacteriales archaeon SW_6_65_15]
MAPFPVLLANRARLTQGVVHEAVHDWLSGHGGFHDVRYAPSKLRREQVHAEVEPEVALDIDPELPSARLEVQFEFPENASRDYYRIQWVVPDRNYSVGWHQHDHRDDLGECHLQLDYGDEVIDVRPADFLDAHPLNVLETRLAQLPEILDGISRTEESPPRFDR